MVVKAVYEFEFDPDTSELDGIIDDKKGFALDLTKRELNSMLDDKCIDSRDFHFMVIDDKNDHSIELPEQTKPTAKLKSKEVTELFDYLDSKIPIASNGVNINNGEYVIEQKYFIPYENYAEDHISIIKRMDIRNSGFNGLDTCFDLVYVVKENNYRYDDTFADCNNTTFYDICISEYHGVINVCKTHYDNDGIMDDKMFITDTTQYINTERIADQIRLINSIEHIHDHVDEINSICKLCLNYLQIHDIL